MNYNEALEVLSSGGKVRPKCYPQLDYFYLENGVLMYSWGRGSSPMERGFPNEYKLREWEEV